METVDRLRSAAGATAPLMRTGVLVSFARSLSDAEGGVQICTREYMAVIKAAGVSLSLLPFTGDNRFSTRLMRRINSSPYLRPVEPNFVKHFSDSFRSRPADFVFLNQVPVAGVAENLRAAAPSSTRFVLLSHGAEITDLASLARIRRRFYLKARMRPTAKLALRAIEKSERASREYVDAVITLSPSDAELERDFGSRNVFWLPRVVKRDPLNWQPVGDYLGFVGTLDHPPNLEGLVQFLEELASRKITAPRVRIVGGPKEIGAWLAGRFSTVDYLGPLPSSELRQEASRWSAFIHPIFCDARGCSTKLATALGWQIPIVTTPQGRRGYVWREGSLLESLSPSEFVSSALSMLEPKFADGARLAAIAAAESSPTVPELAKSLRSFLDELS